MGRSIVIAAAVLAAAMSVSRSEAADVSDGDVMTILRRHCVICHAVRPAHPAFDRPPKNVALETIDEARAWAVKIVEQVVLDRTMPVGNETDMAEAERAALARWLAAMKK
jgi:uncharacterized membrane protein